MSPLVSVVLPCYNAEKFLAEAIESILHQTYANLEILIIDDGSTDLSEKIYNTYLEKDNRIRILKNEKNLGLIQTLNYGIKEAKGDFIARMDADDISEKSRIEKQVQFLIQNEDIAVLGTNAATMNETGKIIHEQSIDFYSESSTLAFSSYFTQPFYHGSLMARAELLKEHQYDSNFRHSEDFELWLRINSKGYKLANIPETLYFYRDSAESVSKNNAATQIESHNRASYKYFRERYKAADFNMVEIMNNRPSLNFTIKEYRSAITHFKNFYTSRPKATFELQIYYIRQQINIAIQAAKKSNSLYVKLYILLNCSPLLWSRSGIKYILQKKNSLRR